MKFIVIFNIMIIIAIVVYTIALISYEHNHMNNSIKVITKTTIQNESN